MRRGFSLVELSIVLVILGLLTGGILAGQSLIHAAELRAVTAEYQRYLAATQTFRDKYFAIAGDFSKATQFWSRTASTADCVTNSSAAVASPGTCDGNGDGTIAQPAAASQSGERMQFWRHLALAGLIEGNYSGYAGSANANDMTLVANAPASKLSSGGWSVSTNTAMAATAPNFGGDYGSYFLFGAVATAGGLNNALIKPEDAWNIDTKLDDGKPATGKIIARFWATSGNTCAIAASGTDTSATYNLTDSAIECGLYFIKQF